MLVHPDEAIAKEKAAHMAALEAFAGLCRIGGCICHVKAPPSKGAEENGHAAALHYGATRTAAGRRAVAINALPSVFSC